MHQRLEVTETIRVSERLEVRAGRLNHRELTRDEDDVAYVRLLNSGERRVLPQTTGWEIDTFVILEWVSGGGGGSVCTVLCMRWVRCDNCSYAIHASSAMRGWPTCQLSISAHAAPDLFSKDVFSTWESREKFSSYGTI